MYPDVRNYTIGGKSALDLIDDDWKIKEFTPRVQKRGAEIIDLRGASSAASAGSASIDHMRDWVKGSSEWQSSGILTDYPWKFEKALHVFFVVASGGSPPPQNKNDLIFPNLTK